MADQRFQDMTARPSPAGTDEFVGYQPGVGYIRTPFSAFATALQGSLADTAVQPGDNVSDLVNDAGYVTNSGYVTVEKDDVAVTQRSILNFEGAGVVVADDTTKTTITISGGAGSGYDTVQDEGSAETQRTIINFTGAGVTVTDDGGNSRTNVDIPGGGAVDSVFGRTGAVAAAASDYDASQVDNDSGVTGATVAAALDTLEAAIPPAAPVDSVNTQTGAVVLDADDISDAATTNKFTTQAEIDKLAAISGTNTGDQTITGTGPIVSSDETAGGDPAISITDFSGDGTRGAVPDPNTGYEGYRVLQETGDWVAPNLQSYLDSYKEPDEPTLIIVIGDSQVVGEAQTVGAVNIPTANNPNVHVFMPTGQVGQSNPTGGEWQAADGVTLDMDSSTETEYFADGVTLLGVLLGQEGADNRGNIGYLSADTIQKQRGGDVYLYQVGINAADSDDFTDPGSGFDVLDNVNYGIAAAITAMPAAFTGTVPDVKIVVLGTNDSNSLDAMPTTFGVAPQTFVTNLITTSIADVPELAAIQSFFIEPPVADVLTGEGGAVAGPGLVYRANWNGMSLLEQQTGEDTQIISSAQFAGMLATDIHWQGDACNRIGQLVGVAAINGPQPRRLVRPEDYVSRQNPVLDGDLDANGNNIDNVNDLTVDNALTVTGEVTLSDVAAVAYSSEIYADDTGKLSGKTAYFIEADAETTNATPLGVVGYGVGSFFSVPADSNHVLKAEVFGKRTDASATGETYYSSQVCSWENHSGTPGTIPQSDVTVEIGPGGTVTSTTAIYGASGFELLGIRVTGAASQTWEWLCVATLTVIPDYTP